MAAPSYTSDLNDINLGTGSWVELTNALAGGSPGAETDFYIEGTGCQSAQFAATGLGSMAFNNGSGISIPTSACVFSWIYWTCPNTLSNLAAGGYRVAIGSATTAYKMWYHLGSDTYTYGGWVNVATDPTFTADATEGSPTSTTQVFGTVVNNGSKVAKGYPYGNDAIRYGRSLIITNGDLANGYGTFSGAATTNDSINNRWGLFQAIQGGYLQKGSFQIGTGTTSADFRDSNKNISIQDCPKVFAGFNRFWIDNASTRVDWTNIVITALGTNSKGTLTMNASADVNFDTCQFVDMDTFIFLGTADIQNTTFRRCGAISQDGAVFNGCTFSNSTATASISATNPSNITNCDFVSDGTNHAIEITVPGEYNFTGNNFTGYATASGSTGNEPIYNNSGGAVTINLNSGSYPYYRNGAGASTSVVSSYTLTLTDIVSGSHVSIVDSSTRDEYKYEVATGADVTWAHDGTKTIDILITHLDYDPNLSSIYNLAMTTSNSSIKIQQVDDPNYKNPPGP